MTSCKARFSGLGTNLRAFAVIGVGVGVFSSSSSSASLASTAFEGDRISIPLLLRGVPPIPLFRGDADRGGGNAGAPSDLLADKVRVGVKPEPVGSLCQQSHYSIMSVGTSLEHEDTRLLAVLPSARTIDAKHVLRRLERTILCIIAVESRNSFDW